ncbi:GNAT family N-acetyltransferase [Actinoplanes sp. NPDC051861]|uniref:GNAT family N-acetyltransferase n=1 Tax=Actinoplanes sp. NPDC051861 TaxID=3155170 RepID=UPI003444A92B
MQTGQVGYGEDRYEMRIRPGSLDDVAAVLRLMDGAVEWLVSQGRTGQWGTAPMSGDPARIARFTAMAEQGELHIATIGDEVVGVLGVGPAMEYVPAAAEPEVYVRLLVTDRARKGSEIGARLLDHARDIARERGVVLLRVDCYAGADGALVRYYERQGFTAAETFQVGEWPGQILAERLDSR